MLQENKTENRINPFFAPYNTPHDTVPFDRIRLEDYEEAFMEGIRRDDEATDKSSTIPKNLPSRTPWHAWILRKASTTTTCSAGFPMFSHA